MPDENSLSGSENISAIEHTIKMMEKLIYSLVNNNNNVY